MSMSAWPAVHRLAASGSRLVKITLFTAILSACIIAFNTAHASAATVSIAFDGSPGTGAPPSTLGGYSMVQFGANDQLVGAQVSGVLDPSLQQVSFSPALYHYKVGQGWATWSNGYTGDVYATGSATSETVTLPADTHAFYLYAEPDPFANFTITAVANDGTSSGPITVNGDSGARYFGFYGTSKTSYVATITISSSVDFAIGEFGISSGQAGQAYQALTQHATSPSAPKPGPVCYLMGGPSTPAVQPANTSSPQSSGLCPPGAGMPPVTIDPSFLSGLWGL